MVDNRQTLQHLQQRILSLSPAQQQLFRKQLEAQGIAWDQVSESAKTQSSTAAITRPKRLPLSASQKHLWVLHQLYPDITAYHISLVLGIEGELQVKAIQQSLQAIVDRHESLRLIIVKEDNHPALKVLPTVNLGVDVIDISKAENKESAIKHWENTLSQQPFNLEAGPLIRAQLLKLEDNRFELILVLHHLIADGWSRGILLKELAWNYQQSVQHTSTPVSSLPVLKFQYPDYVLHQQQWLGNEECQKQRNYWKQKLAGLTDLNLPIENASQLTSRKDVSSRDFASKACTRTFSLAQTNAIKALAKQSGATVFMVLLAIFKLLLQRYSGQRDIAVGIPVAGRNTAAVEPLIGFFVNTLVLRTELREESPPTFLDWLQQVRSTLADALQHQEIPFSEVVEAVGAARIPGKNPLFRVMFQVQSGGYQLQNAEQLGLKMPGLELTQRWIEPSETKFDMSWHVIERDGSLLVAVEYRTGLFEGDRIQKMLDHFHTLTATVVDNPNQRISQFSLLSATERETILNKWNQGQSVEPAKVCFPARFERQVEQTPDVIAVKDQSSSSTKLTYKQLNQRANKLAHWLRNQGVEPNVLVGIFVSSGVDLITGLLATLKAGGAYVPLDPTLPLERLQYMVSDAQPTVLITHSQCLESQPIEAGASKVFYIDKDESQLISQPGHNVSVPIQQNDLAYVIYTSGSTGKPKGTQLTHGGLINYLNWCLKAYPVTEGCGAPVQSSVGFDATITSLFAPLLAGKQVVFGLGNTEIESLQAALSGEFSFIKLTPAHLSALQPLLTTGQIERDRLPSAFIIGGEALQEHHISFWREHYPEIALINEYGPTEAVVGCCVHWVTEDDIGSIPIGRPIDGAQLYILDEYKQPVPAGVPGELYIGGTGVARGYLNQPELTAERFVTGLFQSVLYKTGDLATYQPDGTLHYLGRIDTQIKLRGFRIEPGEIETALYRCEQIEQAVVVLRKEDGKRELVAYITTSAETVLSSRQLSEILRKKIGEALPSYMVPSHFVVLEEFPLTQNGKIDRQALPAPPMLPVVTERVQARDRKEIIFSEIWQQILGRNELSIHDNFFDLGGDSISGMQIVSKAHQQGLHLTPSQLFQYQTIAEQAAVATEKTITDSHSEPVTGSVPLSPIQQDFFEQTLPHPHHYNQAIMLTVAPEINVSALQSALDTLLQHHDALKLRFEKVSQEETDKWQQQYAESENISVPLDEINLTGEESLGLEETVVGYQSTLNLSEGPLFKGVLITLKPDVGSNTTASNKRLLLIAHHLVIDGVSWRILLTDLLTAYQQAESGQTITLPAKTTAFGHWTNHLKEQVHTFESDYAYWEESCNSSSPFPVDQPSEENTVADTHEVVASLNADETTAFKALKEPANAVLLTALAQTLKQWSQRDALTIDDTLTIDIEGHGRRVWDDALDLSRTVGWFTALYPLRLSLLSTSLTEQLAQVKQQLDQVPNSGVSYGVLRTQLGKEENVHESSQVLNSPAQISFNYLGELTLPDTSVVMELAPEPVTALKSPQSERRYLLEIVALIQDGQLQIRWRYSERQYYQQTIEQLSKRFCGNLRSLIAEISSLQSVSPTKFAAARVDSGQLNKLMNKLKAKGGA